MEAKTALRIKDEHPSNRAKPNWAAVTNERRMPRLGVAWPPLFSNAGNSDSGGCTPMDSGRHNQAMIKMIPANVPLKRSGIA